MSQGCECSNIRSQLIYVVYLKAFTSFCLPVLRLDIVILWGLMYRTGIIYVIISSLVMFQTCFSNSGKASVCDEWVRVSRDGR